VTDEDLQLIARGCLEKRRHGSEVTAHAYAQINSSRYGTPMYAYRCRHCGGFHLARHKRGRK
jgi:hypothetical protein